jgi:methionyl-tRNA synthetase
MGIKFRPTEIKAVKNGNGTISRTNKHYYMKAASVKDIISALNSSNTKNKMKDKLRKELIRRGIKND